MPLIFGQGGQFSGNVTASIDAIGAVGAPAPSFAIEIGVIDAANHLVGVSVSNPIRIDPTGTTTQPVEINDGANVMGIMATFGTTPGAVYALNTNASIFAGTTALSATGTSLNVNITGGELATITANQGTSPWIVAGGLTNNNAAPSTKNVGVLSVLPSFRFEGVTQGNMVTLAGNLQGSLRVRMDNTDSTGSIPTTNKYNQIEINFSQTPFNAAVITNTTGGGGTATQSGGAALYSTTASGTAEAKGVTIASLEYRPGHEWYCMFTAAFTVPTDGTNANYQHIGPYNAMDGFYIGWDKTTFNLTYLHGGSTTAVAFASWNGDGLQGAANSQFTNAGTPVAIDFTKLNIFRLRGTWFGAGLVTLEVLAPDDIWVRAHTFHFPNASSLPYTATTNWNITADVKKTGSDSTNLVLTTACWAMGTNGSMQIITDTLTDYSLAVLNRSVIAGRQATGTYANVTLTPDAALQVGGSGDTNVSVATWTTGTQTLIAPVGGATAAATTNVTTLSVVYSPTAGNCAVVMLSTAAAGVTGIAVKDNLGNTLSAGPALSGELASFYQLPVPSGVTGYTATWTTGHQATIAVEEYSGVDSVDASLSGNTNSGSSGTATITAVRDEGGDVVVCALADAGNTFTGTVGNTRQTTTTSTARMILMDTSASPATCTATLTSSAWLAVALGLRPTVSGGTPVNTTLLMVNNSFAYNSVAVQLVGSGTVAGGAITSEVSIDGTHWVGLIGVNTDTGTADTSSVFSLTAATTGLLFNITGYNYFRIRLSSVISGYLGQIVVSYNVQGLASPNVSSTITNGNITVNDNQGTPNTLANAWPFQITDTVNGPVAVKAASTAAITTDYALVVAVSPNNAISTTPAAPTTSIYSQAVISTAANPAVFVPAVGGQTIRVYRIFFVNAGTPTNITIEDSTPTAFSGAFPLLANGIFQGDGNGDPLYVTASGKAFQAINSASQQLSGTVWYTAS